ncbi:hypothetical protein CONPUDRAFT_154852 [Coniophora puteana RWD-64-598 SS2]|uniref:Uncharacterized protein n=1 Tax=Coniophora puteana (strain RWD-64-598) TaxID=741705 RepID=A0A5M3MNX4_CONPW|nr:uncharacterized protein CONPUDRAFT_154852 [Coniophora puteana RWD-64-598 SS2]EIW80869.1 hypothetical protein CONPUDRAFT_154852 [Coniophora puteana RWD-64-598 SS2]
MPQDRAIHPDANVPPPPPPWSSVTSHPVPTSATKDSTFAMLAYIYVHMPMCGGDWDIKLLPSIKWLRTEEGLAAMFETWGRNEERMTPLLNYQTASGLDMDNHGGDEWWEEVFQLYHVSSGQSQGSQQIDHIHVPLVKGINLKCKRPRRNSNEQAGKAQKAAEGSTLADGRSKRTRKLTERAGGGEGSGEGGGEGSRKASDEHGVKGRKGSKGGKSRKSRKSRKNRKSRKSAKGKEKADDTARVCGPPPPPMPSDEDPLKTIFVGGNRCTPCRSHDLAWCIQINNQACTWCKAKKTKCSLPKSHNAMRPQSNATAACYCLGSTPSKKMTPVKPSGTSTSASAVAGPSGSMMYRPLREPPKERKYIKVDSDDEEWVPKDAPVPDTGDKDADGETDREEEDEEQPEEANTVNQVQLNAAEAAEVDAQLEALARLTDALACC